MASFQTFPRKGVALNFAFSPTPTSVTLASPGFLFFKLSSLRGEAEITPLQGGGEGTVSRGGGKVLRGELGYILPLLQSCLVSSPFSYTVRLL